MGLENKVQTSLGGRMGVCMFAGVQRVQLMQSFGSPPQLEVKRNSEKFLAERLLWDMIPGFSTAVVRTRKNVIPNRSNTC